MAYEKQTWVTGETITEEKLNHMEDGIEGAGGVLVIEYTGEGVMTPTMAQVEAAFESGIPVIVHNTTYNEDYNLVDNIHHEEGYDTISTRYETLAYSEEIGWYLPD